ncbi:MAG TPA: 3-phosphoshikimate 1-carboxyvinyltransferase [Gammaproteobacteria bacterium]|nr:3-phosphoshikimate 1-carboxyvinyltransferase [Gammaproteobacteria bacterium]
MSTQRNYQVLPGGNITGQIRVPGDKSISHRAVIFGAIADGITEVTGFLEGEDALATLSAFRQMGVTIEGPDAGKVMIHGVGIHGLSAPTTPLDLGNSGTSMRLLCGLLSGQAFNSTLIGDSSLAKRPMGRVIDPLAKMGSVVASNEGRLPLHVQGGNTLYAMEYALPMASAQVKSCLLLAGLYAEGATTIIEPAPTRDHSERMLMGFSYPVVKKDNRITLQGGGRLQATQVDVPADISSAAFFMVAATISPGSTLTLLHVGINPTRTGIINILRLMGADIHLSNERETGGEPVADITVRYAPLVGINIPEALVPLAIDEFPVIFVAAACARGRTVLTGAQELRVKESDRIQVMTDGLNILGIEAIATDDGIVIEGGALQGGVINSHGDHRIAMAFVVAGLQAKAAITIEDCANVATSFPSFVKLASAVGMRVEDIDG